jgi:uncharacterized protein YjdB
VTLRDERGAILVDRPVTWTSSTPTVATVDATGLVTAIAVGSTVITATAEGKSASLSLTVTPPPVQSIAVTLSSATLIQGTSITAAATLQDDRGNTLSGRTISWSSSDVSVASVDAAGIVTAVGVGSATITASSEGKSGSATVSVLPIPVANVVVSMSNTNLSTGATAQATASVQSATGALLVGRTVTWSTSVASVATVSATGLVQAVSPGTTVISATAEGRTGQVTVTVVPPVASVTVRLTAATIPVGATTTATATAFDDRGTSLTGRAVTWSSSAPAVATVSTSGVVTGVAAGTAIISATSEGRTGSVTITISAPVSVASVSFTGSTRQKVGDPYPITVTARSSDGTVLTRTVRWSVREATRARVNSSGVVTPLIVGTYTLVAEIEGIEWTATYSSYDWESASSGGTLFVTIDADAQVANYRGVLAYPRLIFGCSPSGFFAVWVQISHMITENGAVAYSIDDQPVRSEIWDELGPDYNTLWKRGTNAVKKFFATQIGEGRRFNFAFGEYLSATRTAQWRTTAGAERLPPLLQLCSANVVAGDAQANDQSVTALQEMTRMAAMLPKRGDATSTSDEAERRNTRRLSADPAVSPLRLLRQWPVWMPPDVQEARRVGR